MERQPNLIELGRRPDPVRYMWIFMMENGTLKSGATWMTLKRASEECDYDDVKLMKIVDLVENKVYTITDIPELLEEWRANYFNPQWDIGI